MSDAIQDPEDFLSMPTVRLTFFDIKTPQTIPIQDLDYLTGPPQAQVPETIEQLDQPKFRQPPHLVLKTKPKWIQQILVLSSLFSISPPRQP